jgi:putative tryptophan/tyrosine transport system substrate-binding protein
MEFVALTQDVIMAGSGGIAVELKRTSRAVPIVFPTANDPVGGGLVESLQRPGGNATGFSGFESGQTEKFLELLKQIAERVASRCYSQSHQKRWECKFWCNPGCGIAARGGGAPDRFAQCRCDRAWGRCLRGSAEWRVGRAPCRIGDDSPRRDHHALARYRLPAVYPLRVFVTDGGLISHGPVTTDLYPRVARYIDRILKGLPVQFPVRFELSINHKTAKALGLNVPPRLMALADEVIE